MNRQDTYNCVNCNREMNREGVCIHCIEERQRNPQNYCQCGRGKYFDAICCDVCWNSGY